MNLSATQDTNLFIRQYAKLSQATQKAAFETRFHSIQSGLLNDLNKKIEVIGDASVTRRASRLQKRRDEMVESLPRIHDYKFGQVTNANRFQEINEAGQLAVTSATNDATMTADEAAALNTAKEAIASNIRRLQHLYYPGVDDGQLTYRMGQDAERLEALTAVAGSIDSEGASPTTNDNRPLIDLLNEVSSRAETFQSSTNLLVESSNQKIMDMQKRAFELEADLTSLTVAEMERQSSEIEKLKAQHGNLLKAISIAFEVNSTLGDILAEGSQPPPEKGSVLNLFV